MQARFDGVNGQLTMDISLEDFLCTGMMRRHAKAAMLDSGEELLRDYVCEEPGIYSGDDDLSQAFSEALVMATDSAVQSVQLDRKDVAFIKRHFLGIHLFPREPDPLVA